MAADSGLDVTFIATAEALDNEMTDRITRHQHERPASWATVEAPRALVAAVETAPAQSFLIVDCLSLWVSNLLLDGAADTESQALSLRAALLERTSPSVVVTNEVGLGIVPDNALARSYRDVLGCVNAVVAAEAHTAFLLVSGRALRLDAPPA